jgi:hypothetical protein
MFNRPGSDPTTANLKGLLPRQMKNAPSGLIGSHVGIEVRDVGSQQP